MSRHFQDPSACLKGAQQRTFTNAPAQARPFEGANTSTSEKGRLGRYTNSCASSQRWSRSRPELQKLFRTVHGNQAAMDGFGEYRSDLPLQPKRHTVLLLLLRVSSQSTSEAVLN